MKKGFTLIELLVVITILGVLATIGLTSFRTSQLKSRDARRKSDLEQVQRALEMYNSDVGTYPSSTAQGAISGFSWGDEFKDIKGTVYMKELPKESSGNPEYCYKSVGSSYQLYARLENTEDQKATLNVACGVLGNNYNYGVSSSNVSP